MTLLGGIVTAFFPICCSCYSVVTIALERCFGYLCLKGAKTSA